MAIQNPVTACGVDSDGESEAQGITSGHGHGHVTTSGGGIAHNRNLVDAASTYATATNTATWTEAEGIKNLRIMAFTVSTVVSNWMDGYRVVINAPNTATATTWLADDGLAAQDVMYEVGFVGQELLIQRTAPITRLDIVTYSSVDVQVGIGATP